MNLYEIDKRINEILEHDISIDEETGEVFDVSALDGLDMLRNEKAEHIALYIKNITAEADAIANEVKTLTERKRVTQNKAERLKQYLATILNGDKVETPRVRISYRASTSVNVENVDAIPDEYVNLKIEKAADKKAIAAAMKGGAEIPGCTLVTENKIQIK